MEVKSLACRQSRGPCSPLARGLLAQPRGTQSRHDISQGYALARSGFRPNLKSHCARQSQNCMGTPKVNPPSCQLPAGGWPGARAGWLAACVHPVSLRFMHDACMI